MSDSLVLGVLALQGAFREHMTSLRRVPGVTPVEVRTREQLWSTDGLVIPGGESTTMGLVAKSWGLLEDLQRYVHSGRPVWGTCAGLIFLADRIEHAKQGGQALIGGLGVNVSRNFFGAQIESFEIELPAPEALREHDAVLASAGPRLGVAPASRAATLPACPGGVPTLPDNISVPSNAPTFRALFIRAPAVLDAEDGVEVLATCPLTPEQREKTGRDSVIVAVRSDKLLATSFHPELTNDSRWHALFADMVKAAHAQGVSAPPEGVVCQLPAKRGGAYPLDLPTFAA